MKPRKEERESDMYRTYGLFPAPLSPEKEAEILGKLQGKERKEAREILVEHNLGLVVCIAKKFNRTEENMEDLISVGTIGLIKAVNTYDESRKIKLATYAARCVKNEMLMYLRAGNKREREISINVPLYVDREGNECFLLDVLGTDKDMLYQKLERKTHGIRLQNAVRQLSDRERAVVQLRYGINTGSERNRTQKEVAQLLGVSQSYLSRLERKIIRQLREQILL